MEEEDLQQNYLKEIKSYVEGHTDYKDWSPEQAQGIPSEYQDIVSAGDGGGSVGQTAVNQWVNPWYQPYPYYGGWHYCPCCGRPWGSWSIPMTYPNTHFGSFNTNDVPPPHGKYT